MNMRKRKGQAGFTLVELMIVAIIVAILAAVAIPLMSANKMRARVTEAEAGLGTVRSAFRAMFAETGAYNTNLNGVAIAAGAVAGVVPGISVNDLNGRWFNDAAYDILSISGTGYTVRARGSSSSAPKASEVAGIVITLDQDGNFTRTGL